MDHNINTLQQNLFLFSQTGVKTQKKLTLCYSSSNQLRPECHCQKSCISSKVGSASYNSATASQDCRNQGQGGNRPLYFGCNGLKDLLFQRPWITRLPWIFRHSYGPNTTAQSSSECMYVPKLLLLTTLQLVFIKNHPKIMKTVSYGICNIKQF